MRGVSITVQNERGEWVEAPTLPPQRPQRPKPRIPSGMKLHYSRSGVFATALARDGRVLRVAGTTTTAVTTAMAQWLRWEARCAGGA